MLFHRKLLCFILPLWLLIAYQVEASGIRDHPVVAGPELLLDGQWTALNVTSSCDHCTLLPHVDFNEGHDGPNVPASSADECCQLCGAMPLCAAATFYQGRLANEADISSCL
jgi:hypothetical protein